MSGRLSPRGRPHDAGPSDEITLLVVVICVVLGVWASFRSRIGRDEGARKREGHRAVAPSLASPLPCAVPVTRPVWTRVHGGVRFPRLRQEMHPVRRVLGAGT